MSASAIPERFSAASTRSIFAAFAETAATLVDASVDTPSVRCAVSGAAFAVPVPVTVIPVGLSGAALCAGPGRSSPTTSASAPAAAASARILISFMSFLPWLMEGTTPPASAYVTSRRGRRREARQVRLPAARDLRRREPDEEHRCRRARLPAQLHPRFVRQLVALLQGARRARGDEVLPDRLASSAPRNDVVERQPAAGGAAVDALPAVAGKQGAAGDFSLHRARHADVLDE